MTLLPVEIWMMVFHYLLMCPTLPEHFEDVFFAFGLLAQHCDAWATYVSTLKTASVCRQVSRTWKGMIDSRPCLASRHLESGQATAALMDMRKRECNRHYKCMVCRAMPYLRPARSLRAINPEHVRAWIDPMYRSRLTIPHILATFPCLTSLSVDWPESGYTLSQLSVDAPRLLNLRITSYTTADYGRRAILDLHHLLLLSISATDSGKRIPFGRWNLPLLTSLDITVYGSPAQDPNRDNITALLRSVGPHLRYLGHVRYSSYPATHSTSMNHLRPPPGIWQLCPQLDTISLSYWGFRRSIPPPPEYPQRLVVGLLDFQPGSFKKSRDYEQLITFGEQVKAWSGVIDHFRFGVSWDVFFVGLNLYDEPWRVPLEVVEGIHLCNLVVYDIHHIPSHEYMERWQEFEERAETGELITGAIRWWD